MKQSTQIILLLVGILSVGNSKKDDSNDETELS